MIDSTINYELLAQLREEDWGRDSRDDEERSDWADMQDAHYRQEMVAHACREVM